MSYLKIYDTTLRDGAQNPFVRFTTEGKLEATHVLDELGVDYIEGGFPQAGGHCDYFSKVKDTTEAKIAAFGMTPRTYDFDNDPSMKALLDTDADVITLVVKTPEPQIRRVLGKSPRVYRAIAGDAIRYLKSLGKEVVVDAEHFFDEYKRSPGSAMALLDECGDADWLVLCDTNGGAMYRDVSGVVRDVIREVGDRVGVHFHNDRGLALANTLKAAYAGARHLQVTMNGMGERTGNANLVEVVGNLYDKGFGIEAEPHKLTDASRSMEKLSGWSMTPNAPFVGRLAFSHSGGMHSDAMLKWQKSYEHAEPGTFGNERAFPISGQSGRAAITMKLSQWGYDMDKNHPVVRGLLDDIGGMGYVGDAQFYLMFSRYDSSYHDPIEIESMRVTDNITSGGSNPEAVVRFRSNGRRFYEVSEGEGQVDALDSALRKALRRVHPEIDDVKLLSYTVPPITGTGADASVQVRVYFGNNGDRWDSMKEGTDIIAASADALLDAYRFFLLRQEDKNR